MTRTLTGALCAILAVVPTAASAAPGPDYHSPHERAWRCIRWHETVSSASFRDTRAAARQVQWGLDDGLYSGAYQADEDFARSYGPEYVRRWGARAGRWPRWAQTVMADRGYAARGFQPWPNTAAACGLR